MRALNNLAGNRTNSNLPPQYVFCGTGIAIYLHMGNIIDQTRVTKMSFRNKELLLQGRILRDDAYITRPSRFRIVTGYHKESFKSDLQRFAKFS